MNDCGRESQVEAHILNKIAEDFEALDRTIEAAIALLQAGKAPTGEELSSLQRARDAARKGAALARSKVVAE